MMQGWMINGWGADYGLFGWLIMLFFWILIVVGAVYFVRWLVQQGGSKVSGTEETPLEILRKRYARGEIDKEQFESVKRELM